MLANYLAAEPLIVERLHAELPQAVRVLSAADLAGVREAQQFTPAVHVIYDGDDLGEAMGDDFGESQIVRQRWLVVIAVRNARTQTTGAAAREDAGSLITQALAALSGWRPEGFGPLVRAPAPKPAFSGGGFAYFPLLFRTTLITGD